MKQYPKIGVGVIVIKDRKVLLGKRKGTHGAEHWQFPGGHLEFGESVESCATREIYEETGLHIRHLRSGPFTNDIFEQEGKHYVTLFVIADYAGGHLEVKEPEKCECWEWFEWQHLPQPLFLPIQHLLQAGFDLQVK